MANRKFKAFRHRQEMSKPVDMERGMRNIRMIVSAVYSAAARFAAEEAAQQNSFAPAEA